MQQARMWLLTTIVAATLGGSALLIATTSSAGAAQGEGMKSHWRNHDGHWSYYHEGDKRWYYTDGKHWYYNDNDRGDWKVYNFDRQFGKEGFVRGDYKLPGVDIKLDLPRHLVFTPK